MEEDEQEQRRKKVEAGRAKLAHFRQRKTKGDGAHPKKKTAKRKGSAVDAPVQEESPVASEEGGRVGGGDTLDGAGAAQECERACEPAVAEPMGPCEDETGGQQRTMGGCPPPAEEQQVQLPAQPVAALELEALRLSLSNMHAARLELTQAHLQREKDSALAELRDALSSRHAQELALLHSRQQLQLEEVALRCHRETAELKEKLQSEMERNVQMTESLKQSWESERELCLETLRRELSAQHQSELQRLRSQFEEESAEREAEVEQLSQARSQAELSLQALRAQYEAASGTPQEAVDDTEPGGREPPRGGQLQAEHDSAGGLQEGPRRAPERVQLLTQELRERQAEWRGSGEAREGPTEARPTRTPPDTAQRAHLDGQPPTSTFALRELQMRQLQDAQAAQIRALEAALVEQQGRLRQLELELAGDASPQCSQCGWEPGAGPAPVDRDQALAAACLQEDCALQLQLAQNRFLEQRKEITEKLVAEQDAVLREAQEEHSRELQLLRDRHRQHVASLTAELQARHQADTAELRALSEARVAALRTEHAAEIRALQSRHASDLEAVEALGEEHRRALRGDPGGQLRGETWELQNVHRKQDAEPQPTEASPGVEPAERAEGLGAHQSEPGGRRTAASREQETRGRAGERPLSRKNPEEALCPQLPENEDQVLQLKEQVLSLSRELERLRQTRDRENQEGAHLIAMLQSDADLCHGQRTALQDALRRLLGLFGETLKAAVGLRSRISERVGLCLEDDSPPDARPGGQAPPAAPAPETWPGADVAAPGLDGTLPECAETSSVAEISSHLCESFFTSPESTLECEQPVRRVYRSLGLAVDGLLEMVLDSSRQLEEARQIHARLEKEFSSKSEETAQLVRKHQELLDRLEEQNAAQTQLTLDLHKAEGIIEGFKVEKANLQEALGQKEAAERGLVVQLEDQSQQLQQAARQQAELREQNAVLTLQAEAVAAAAQEREAALRRELEDVAREHLESQRQSAKDRGALLAQTRALEAELEEQLGRHRACAEHTAELSALRQQLASLDKHLRGQRHFMDEQAAEWEQEREEFQQEVRRLEERLRQAARPQPGSPPDREVELLQEKLREKSDELDALAIKKELADRQVSIQEEEIKHLEETNANTRRQVLQLQEELEKQTKAVEELRQDKEAWQEQPKSTSPPTSPPGPGAQLEQRESETALRDGEEEALRGREQAAALAGTGRGAPSEAVHSRSAEVEELRSVIEALQENQERLQKDRAAEVQQLHEVIERLQGELCPRGPAGREHSAGRAHSLRGPQAGGAGAQAPLHAELQAALAAPEALSRLLAEQGRQHGQALGALQQRLRSAEQAAARQLAQREAEARDLASPTRELEAALKAKDAAIAERDVAIAALSGRALARRAELEAVRCGLSRLRRALERRPPERQRLQAPCVRLRRHLPAPRRRFRTRQDGPLPARGGRGGPSPAPAGEEASCEAEPHRDVGSGQLADAPHALGGGGGDPQSPAKEGPQPARALVTPNTAGVRRQDSVVSVLTVCQRQLQSELLLVKNEMRLTAEARGQGEEPPLEDCKLRKAGLVTQVKQLQEKLNRLIYSMNFQNIEAEDFTSQQPLAFSQALENSLSDRSSSGEETDRSPPACNETTWDLVDVAGNQESRVTSEVPRVSVGESEGLQDRARVSLHGGCRGLARSQGPEPLQNALSTLDASWGSPELVRKDSTLEPLPSLPLTPCSAASLLQADQSGLLCSPGGLAAVKGPGWSESPSAVDRAPSASHHVQRTAVEKDVENFIVTSLDSQGKSRSPPSGLEGKSDGREKSDGDGAETLVKRGPGGRAVPAAPRPTWQSAMKEKAMPAEHVEVLLQMVCDESRHILALSEHHGPLSALGQGEPVTPLEHFLRRRRGPLEVGAAPRKGEEFQEPSGTCLDWEGTFLQGVQEAFTQEWDEARLSQRLEEEVQEQAHLKEKPSELLRLPERSGLLSEVQALRAQLRLTHLQNQEKLQQLCAALSSAEARGSWREHRLRRQVELLAYKVEQEKGITGDLQKTLSEEQEKASSVRKLLGVEENAVRALRAELCECKQDNERLLASLRDVQQEAVQLRSVLDGKEQDLRAALQELQSARGEERTLQGRLEQERLQRLQAEGQSAQALGELRATLGKQRARNSQLCVALRHEQAAKDNLQKELRIEASRCDALLAQEQARAAALRRRLEAEQSHALELSEALRHERLLTERLSRRPLAVPRRPKEERARGAEPQAAPGEAQPRREELKREKERELELQRQRQEHKIQQLQRTARELEAREAARRPPEAARLHEQQQGLEKIRQQLLGAAELLTGFINQTVDRTINDWTSSNEKAVTSLVQTLEELRSELSASSSPQKNVRAEQQAPLVDVLLKDNDSLRKALSVAAREKAALGRAAARLERTLTQHVLKGCALSRSDRSAWRRDRKVLQSSLGLPDPGLPPPAAGAEADASNVKMERLYLHYLRAESFRKALIYQKKYLLLLIGGFQDSEQETLSMIAHLGVFPSKADKKMTSSRPFTKFRTAVRVVIAISRLRFLVRKWQEVGRKGALVHGRAPRSGFPAPPRQQAPPDTRASPPTRDVPASHTRDPLPKASPRRRERSSSSPNSRSEGSYTASQDPEHSLTEYIHHLEVIQQRLGGVLPDPISKKSCRQKTKE